MPRKVKRDFCTMFIRSESEKKMWKAAQEVDKQEAEIDELKRKFEELSKLVGQTFNIETETNEVNIESSGEEESSPEPKKRSRSK